LACSSSVSKQGTKPGLTESSSRVVVVRKQPVHRGVDGLQGVPRLDDEDGEQVRGLFRG
jgi:hypothetical protein